MKTDTLKVAGLTFTACDPVRNGRVATTKLRIRYSAKTGILSFNRVAMNSLPGLAEQTRLRVYAGDGDGPPALFLEPCRKGKGKGKGKGTAFYTYGRKSDGGRAIQGSTLRKLSMYSVIEYKAEAANGGWLLLPITCEKLTIK